MRKRQEVQEVLWCRGMSQGLFRTFEGIDGCGKSTQLRAAADFLAERHIDYVVTREPGGTPLAEKIRELILAPEHDEMVDSCEILLYLAARAQHVETRIRPALEQGRVILCDRFAEATVAYQGFGRGLDSHQLERLNAFATGGLVPTATFLFDVSVETAHGRMQAMGKEPDRLEQNSLSFHGRVRDGYLRLASRHADRIIVLDGERGPQALAGQVRERLQALLTA
jgi:dTMP kinase